MSFQGIVTGLTPNDGQGDTLLTGAIKTNDNFKELYRVLGDGTNLGIATLTQLKTIGVITATAYYGDGSTLSNISASAATYAEVAGIATVAENLTGTPDIVIRHLNSPTGVITAALFSGTFSGDATGLSGVPNINVGVVTATQLNGPLTGDVNGNLTGTATTANNLADGANITTGTISNNRLPANITKNLTGDVTGNLTGDVTGNLTGNVTGNLTGNVTGTATTATNLADAANITTGTISNNRLPVNITKNLVGNVTGNVTGNLTGNVTGTATTATNLADGGNITTGTISNDRLPSTITKNLTGDVTGNLIGNVTGNVTGTATTATIATNAQGLTGSPNITVTDITAFGNVSIAGTLTYEDVTNVDSIGLITARNGLQVDSGGINVTGNSTITGILTVSEYRFPNYGSTNYTRLGSGELLVSGVNDKGSVQVGALTTVFSMGHAPFNNNCYFSQTGENDWVFWSGLTTTSMTVNGGISTRPHSVTLRKLYVDTNADIDGNLSVSGIATLGSHTLGANDFKVGTTLNFKSSDGSTNILTLNQSGSVDLYHNTNKKFETTASGVEVTGGLVADNLSVSGVSTFTGLTRHVGVASFFDDVNFLFDDSVGKVTLGPNKELEIFHANATGNSVIKESGSGSLILAGDNVVIRNSANNETKASFISDGAANLFFNNGKKFETTGIGASVLGTLEVFSFAEIGSGLNVSGIVTATTFNGALHGTALLSEGLTGTPDITVDDITAAQINVSGLTTTTNKVEVRSTDSTPGRVDLFCEVSNAHYARLQAPFHSAFSGNVVATLPTKSGNLIVGDSAAIDNDINTTGIITASSFSGSGSNLTSLTGASAGSYGGGFSIPVITVDANGRITGISTAANAGAQGGGGGIANVVDDTAPQLGGNLDLNGNNITGNGNINFSGTLTATSIVKSGGTSSQFLKADGSVDSSISGDKISEGDSKAEIIDTATESKLTVEIDATEKFSVDTGGTKIHRQDSSNEGGSVVFNRANDDNAAFEIDVYGSSNSDSGRLRILDQSGPSGVERFTIGPAGQIGLSGANYGTSGQVLTSNGSSSAPTWQTVSGGGGGGGGTGINVQNNGVAIGSTTTQTINFNNDLEATVNGSVVTVNSTAPSQATAIALAIALG